MPKSGVKKNAQPKQQSGKKQSKQTGQSKNKSKANKNKAKKQLGPQHEVRARQIKYAGNLMPNQDERVQISATVSLNSYRSAFVALASYLCQKGVVSVDTPTQPNQAAAIYNGLSYLMSGGVSNFTGTTAAINELPKVVDNWFQALLPKQLKWDMGTIAYGFKQFAAPTSLSGLPYFGHIWSTTFVDTDDGTAAQVAPQIVSGPDPDVYSALLSIVNKLDPNGMLSTVDFKLSERFTRDVSSYSRVYSYCGNQSSAQTAGSWLDVENEVKVTAPLFAHMVPYQDSSLATDPRLPQDLKPFALDSLSILGWPLHQSFCSYYNKTPPKNNQIDVDQIYCVAALWMAKLKAKAAELGVVGATDPLPMTSQTFYLVLRNALMVLFDSQYFMQFQGNNQWTNNANAFLGFFVMGHCAGNSTFGRLNLPEILVENLGALKARSIYGLGGGKNPKTYLPTIGRWYRDTLPEINVLNADGTVFGPLFTPVATPAEPLIDFIDVTAGPDFINVQGTYYLTAMDDWNEAVEKFKQYSAPVQEIATDGGPKGMLITTAARLIGRMIGSEVTVDSDGKKHYKRRPGPPQRMAQSLTYLENKTYEAMRGKDGKKVYVPRSEERVKLLPDATMLELTTTSIISKFQITQEAHELYDIIILPTERTDNTNDVLNKGMLQVMGRQAYSYEQQSNAIATEPGSGAGEFIRCNQYANELVTGLAREKTTKFQQIWEKFIEDGEGGFLASILGGVAKGIFPGNDAIIDTISSVVPI